MEPDIFKICLVSWYGICMIFVGMYTLAGETARVFIFLFFVSLGLTLHKRI